LGISKGEKRKKKEKENLILADELWVFFVCPFARFLIFSFLGWDEYEVGRTSFCSTAETNENDNTPR
jgi:hypothetical protein